MRCPICGHELEPATAGGGASPPFCSARCRAVDLGRWLTESYRIPGTSVQEETTPARGALEGVEGPGMANEEDLC